MKKHYNYFLIFISLLFIAAFSSCQYDNPVAPAPPDPGVTVSFATQTEPIFNNGNTCTACHKTGAQAPDLTTGNAYNSIVNMNLVNASTPESSLIYWYPDPTDTANHTWKKYTAAQAQLVLLWIQQGAKNN